MYISVTKQAKISDVTSDSSEAKIAGDAVSEEKAYHMLSTPRDSARTELILKISPACLNKHQNCTRQMDNVCI